MTLDSSALIAILFAEPGHLDLLDLILQADVVRVGTPTLVETEIVLSARRGKPAATDLQGLLEELHVTIVPFGESEWRAAVRAFERFGRGRHEAGLNFGDCLSYAVAEVASDSLLFVGDDFASTDITPASGP
ncbi:MAG: type II toxin-antitoxin system VapC family toxin [Acidobacteria bacterium]|nr:type II toxin-antitoxin system VapC family toxin [Acidobacteriota bacterium]